LDHERVSITTTPISCGISQVYRIGEEPEEVAYAMAASLYHPSRGTPVAMFIWSGTKDGNAMALRDYLGLTFGGTTVIGGVDNPKTGNVIYLFTWCIPHEEFRKWYMEQRVARLKKG